jgi:diadenosine tetraphosphatase ApaH/serine/threonine PP2A family protein phosphatase
MRILVLSDIHGNLHALDAVLQAAAGIDAIWNLGDTVGYGAYPNEVVERMQGLARVNVRGNHDRVCSGLTSAEGFNPVAANAAAWTRRNLTAANLEWVRSMPQGPVNAAPGVQCAHGSPLHEDHYIISMRDAWLPLQRMSGRITFFGHTHVQGIFLQTEQEWAEERPQYANGEDAVQLTLELSPQTRALINPGSVGQPRDGDWRAAFAIYEDKDDRITFRRVPYDVSGAQKAIREAGLPERLAARLSVGR